jgi:Fe-S-cluster-containing dehydrogenase component
MQPSCCEVCPTGARIFGDLSDEASTVSLLIKKHNGWQMLPDKGTDPCVYYVG